jgi:hypothetical protein
MFHANTPLKIKAFLLIVLSCTKTAHSMQAARDRVRANREAQMRIPGAINMAPTYVLDDKGVAHKASEYRADITRSALLESADQKRGAAARIVYDRSSEGRQIFARVPRGARNLIATFLLRPDHFAQPELIVLNKEQSEQADRKRADDAAVPSSLVDATQAQRRELTSRGTAAAMRMVDSANFHDFIIKNYLMELIPAVVNGQSFDELQKALKNLYTTSRLPIFRDLQGNYDDSDTRCIATEFVRGEDHWQRTGYDNLWGAPEAELYEPENRSFIIERHVDGTLRFKVHDRYLQRIRELSPKQIDFILDLAGLMDPVNLILIAQNHDAVLQLSVEQARVFLTLPLDIKENILRCYPVSILMDHMVNRHSIEFLPALRIMNPATRPLTREELRQEADDGANLLSSAEIELIRGLTFEQREYIRSMHQMRGQAMAITDRAYEFVNLPKDMQERLLKNYPLVKFSYFSWSKGMIQKHPKKTAAIATLGLGGGLACAYFGKAKVVAAIASATSKAAPIAKVITVKNAQKAAATATIAVGAAYAINHLHERNTRI